MYLHYHSAWAVDDCSIHSTRVCWYGTCLFLIGTSAIIYPPPPPPEHKPTDMPFQQSYRLEVTVSLVSIHSMTGHTPYPLQWMLMIPLILWVEYNLQVCPATSAIYPDFMLLTSYLWKFILVCRSLDYKLLNGSAPRSSQDFSPISRTPAPISLIPPMHCMGLLHCVSTLLLLMAWTPNPPCSRHLFQQTILPVSCSSCLYIVLYLVACMDRTPDARAASSSCAPFGFNSLSHPWLCTVFTVHCSP
jgi:hypothetical protein